MIDYGIQCSAVEPQPIEITGSSILINTNIIPYSKEEDGRTLQGYKYNCIGYTKDEYILKMTEKNAKLEQDLIDTQVALCDLYEALEGD